MSSLPRSTAVSLALTAAYLVQGLAGLHLPMLNELQSQFSYQFCSGTALGIYLGGQWLLALARSRKWRSSARLLRWHKSMGALAPAVLFVHSTEIGFGYLGVLSSVYLANVVVAAAGPDLLPQRRAIRSAWIVLHVALSAAAVITAGHHAWLALVFT